MNAFRAELLKATTTRVLLWFGLGLFAFLVLVLSIHIGSLLVTTEYAHGTINQSFLAVPVRGRLLAAKLAAGVVVVFVVAALADAVTLVISELWYHGRGESLHLGSYTLAPLLGAVGASMLAGGIGVGLGALIRRQTGTIVMILLWLLIGEGVISAAGDSARFAPGHALGAVVAAHRTSTSGDMLAVWPAVIVGLVYVAIFCGVGFLAVAGSDVPSRGD